MTALTIYFLSNLILFLLIKKYYGYIFYTKCERDEQKLEKKKMEFYSKTNVKEEPYITDSKITLKN
jgi:hypothetical protein